MPTVKVFSAPGKSKNAAKEDLSFMFIAQMNCLIFECSVILEKTMAIFFQDCFKQTVN